jgi:hypothetical protein
VIDWTTLEPGLVTIFRALSGVAEVRWEGAVARFPDTATQATIDLSVVSVVGLGRDELRYRRPTSGEAEPPTPGLDPWGGAAPALYETSLGWREIVVRAKVESALQSPGAAARVYVERIRDRLRWSDVLTALRALGLGYCEIAASVDLSAVRDKRMRSIAAIDVRFNALSEAVNPIGMPGIESATFGAPTT